MILSKQSYDEFILGLCGKFVFGLTLDSHGRGELRKNELNWI